MASGFFEQLTESLLQENGSPHEYGCLMLDLDIPEWEEWQATFSKEDFDEENSVDFPHVTVVYGFHDGVVPDKPMRRLCEKRKPNLVEISGVEIFEHPEYDVLVYRVTEDALVDLHERLLLEYPNTQKFTEYKPHVTLAYLKPGTGKQYREEFVERMPESLRVKGFRFSSADGSVEESF